MTKRTFILNPIIDWKDSDIWDFIKMRKLPYNPLYDMGFKRVGCIGCPMNSNRKKELEKNQKYKSAYIRATKKYIEYRIKKGLEIKNIMETPEQFYNWWVNG
jgi:phosphoadenosine phosphosulfate reductase